MVGGLQLSFVDWEGARNHAEHRTGEAGGALLVVRRGQPFALTLHFRSRAYLPGRDAMYLVAETGPSPDPESGTRAVFLVGLGQRDPRCVWRGAFLRSVGPHSTEVSVSAPAEAPVGRYTLKIRLDAEGGSSSYRLGEFVLLFNAWCPEDEVYLGNEEQRREFVLEEEGIIFQGNKNWLDPTPWHFGQFEEGILGICLKVLDRSLNSLKDPAEDAAFRRSAVYVSRVLSAMINSDDDGGVVLGNWSEDYTQGTRPSAWTGSVAILREWARAGGRPVRYGQCWVFAGVLCTVMRCLGVPTRVVTNFESGHEKDGNLVIDVCYDEKGRLMESRDTDCIWNFHVWNECWMARKDLPPGYGGWQVVDSTPQERSKGLFCCGPASVRAVREGELSLPFDTPFVFSMVNADRVVWMLHGAHRERIQVDTGAVGLRICTKALGSDADQDITAAYKPKEGSKEERAVFEKAVWRKRHLEDKKERKEDEKRDEVDRPGRPPRRALHERRARSLSRGPAPRPEPLPAPSVSKAATALHLRLAQSPQVGQDVELKLLVSNCDQAWKEVTINMAAQPLRHNGHPGPACALQRRHLTLGPGEEKELAWRIPFEHYGPVLSEGRQLRISAVAEEGSSWHKALAEKTVTVATSTLRVKALSPAVLHKSFPLQVVFSNPLSEVVGRCLLTVEGSGLLKGQMQIELGCLAPRAETSVTFHLTPFKAGPRQVHVSLTGSQFAPIKGRKCVQVASAPSTGWRVRRGP
ncbi:protein-glutamine gamma-glutamyltransferase 5-like [Anolis sagrei]|uniref:protein-glutamine gamma-glutamyltransferase 5-like n=1 Tax=Anolis sagrei TaxID=38937 RepID=UPI0035228CCE